MSTLRYALEKLCDYAEAETKDRRPRDKHGPIGRAPIASITVGDLRGLLMAHTTPEVNEGFTAITQAAQALETAEAIAVLAEEAADDLDPPVTGEWLVLRDWFKDQLHALAAQAREVGGER